MRIHRLIQKRREMETGKHKIPEPSNVPRPRMSASRSYSHWSGLSLSVPPETHFSGSKTEARFSSLRAPGSQRTQESMPLRPNSFAISPGDQVAETPTPRGRRPQGAVSQLPLGARDGPERRYSPPPERRRSLRPRARGPRNPPRLEGRGELRGRGTPSAAGSGPAPLRPLQGLHFTDVP